MPSVDQRSQTGRTKLPSNAPGFAGWKPYERYRCAYCAGPMADLEDHNYPAFDAAAARLRGGGWRVFCPSEGVPHAWQQMAVKLGPEFRATLEYKELMARDIDWVLRADVVYVLPGWQASSGARIELAVAQTVGRPIIEYATGELIRCKLLVECA